jgi:hypothetical protein
MPSSFFSIVEAMALDITASPALAAFDYCTAQMMLLGIAVMKCTRDVKGPGALTVDGWMNCAAVLGFIGTYVESGCWDSLIKWGASDVYSVYSGGLRISLEDQDPVCDFGYVRYTGMVGTTPVRSCIPPPITCADGAAPGQYPNDCSRSCGTKQCVFVGVANVCGTNPCYYCMQCQ